MRIGIALAFTLLAASSAVAQSPESEAPPDATTVAPEDPIPVPELTCRAILLSSPITFEVGDDALDGRGRAIVERVAELLRENDWITHLTIEVHSDDRGAESFNRRLTQKRAELIVNELYLNGIARERLTAQGFGEERPVERNDTPEGRAQNRRVELRIDYEDCPIPEHIEL